MTKTVEALVVTNRTNYTFGKQNISQINLNKSNSLLSKNIFKYTLMTWLDQRALRRQNKKKKIGRICQSESLHSDNKIGFSASVTLVLITWAIFRPKLWKKNCITKKVIQIKHTWPTMSQIHWHQALLTCLGKLRAIHSGYFYQNKSCAKLHCWKIQHY